MIYESTFSTAQCFLHALSWQQSKTPHGSRKAVWPLLPLLQQQQQRRSRHQPFVTNENVMRKEIRAQVICWNGVTASFVSWAMPTRSSQWDGVRKPAVSLFLMVAGSQTVCWSQQHRKRGEGAMWHKFEDIQLLMWKAQWEKGMWASQRAWQREICGTAGLNMQSMLKHRYFYK